MKQVLQQSKSKQYRACLCAVIVVMFTMFSCSNDDGPSTVKVTGIKAVSKTREIAVSGTLQLSASVTPEDATNQEVNWSSSDTSIATVGQDGLVKAIAPGEVTITVAAGEDDSIKDSVVLDILEISNAITSFSINGAEGTIEGTDISILLTEEADITKLSPEITHNGASIAPASGEEQDFSEPVTYTVTAENGDTRQYTVTVEFVLSAIDLTAERTEVETGLKISLTAHITPENVPDRTITWSSSDTSVAFVDEEGVVTGIAKGEVVITATSNSNPDINGSITLTVTQNDFVTTWNGQSVTIPTHPDYAGAYNFKVDWDNDGIFDEEGITGNVTHTFDTSGEHIVRVSGDFPAVYFFKAGTDVQRSIISLDQWGTIAWQYMGGAFSFCSNLVVKATDIPDLSNVENLASMFRDADKADPDVSGWDTSNITNMFSMFKGATIANPDVSGWNTSKVTTMAGMFSFARNANPDVSGWDTSNVTTMYKMFFYASAANPDVSGWDTSKITDISLMFTSASSANPDVSGWDTSKVIRMNNMFSGASVATPDVSGWNTGNVINMNNMFYSSAANPDVSGWNISKVTNVQYMFYKSEISKENYEKALIRFAAHAITEGLTLPQNIDLGTVSNSYCSDEAETARQLLMDNGWNIPDQGKVCD